MLGAALTLAMAGCALLHVTSEVMSPLLPLAKRPVALSWVVVPIGTVVVWAATVRLSSLLLSQAVRAARRSTSSAAPRRSAPPMPIGPRTEDSNRTFMIRSFSVRESGGTSATAACSTTDLNLKC